jgi:hypothetical protein
MKNIKYSSKIFISSLLILSSCATTVRVQHNASEQSIKNEVKSFTVLGNLRVEIPKGQIEFDSIMKAAITQYGQKVDVINIKKDETISSFGGGKVINCLVIRYD